MINKSNEIKALHAYISLLSTFDVSNLNEDLGLLENVDVCGRLRTAVMYRVERMKIVKNAFEMCEEGVRRISSM